MQITKTTLRRIIKEELKAVMNEGRASETPAERKERIAAEKDAKAKADRARGSYYRHEPPNRPETYPGEFASRYMQEDATMNEDEASEDAAEDAAYDNLESCVRTVIKDLLAAGVGADAASNIVFAAVRSTVYRAL
jgi:hypothetical protein